MRAATLFTLASVLALLAAAPDAPAVQRLVVLEQGTSTT